ncbi:ankyrin [Annulohypoxylon maeteangense]|uniref:ankyrin n=1 Tax=Annulohypoxylon maeteangense TaxID=1927788 RepID=UPI002007D957|nr:ankyrin [Annulohypoxylon maeteangense]KAI0885920.1 ankyrin [Annulohypoxylon maeteangense]
MSNVLEKMIPTFEPDTALNNAAKKGDINAVRRIFKDNPNYAILPGRTRTPLHYAAMDGHHDVVKILLAHGEPVDAPTRQGWTPLTFAAIGGHSYVAATLIYAKADVNSQILPTAVSNAGYTPLHIAASLDSCDVLHLLVAKGALVKQTATSGVQPLHIAVKYGRRLNTLILCAFGSDPYAKDSNGEDAYDYADKLHQPLRGEIRDIINKWCFQLENLSWLRANLGNFVTVAGKIEVRSLLARASNSTDELSLVYAAEVGDAKFIDCRDTGGRTPLHNATVRGNFTGAEYLLNKGVDVNCRSKNRKWTALLMAVDIGHEKLVRALIQHGAYIEAETDQGDNAITLARKWNHTKIADFLETLASPKGLTVPPSRSPARRRSPSPFRMIRAENETFMSPTAQAIRQVRIVRPPKFKKSEPNQSEEVVGDIELNPNTDPEVDGGFDGGLFSTSIPDSGLVQPKTFNELTSTWRNYFDFKEKDKRIKVAVLDTGIDLDHEDWLQPRALRFEHGKQVPATGEPRQIDRIKNKINFCGGSETDVQDLDGHGTQVAGIILRLAPRADIDIARVCVGNRNRGITEGKSADVSSAERCPQPTAVAKAIDWAIENHADIINMSFGYEYSPGIVREALKRAQKERIVVFAAMSNGGSYQKSTWPAREEACAIGIHSCDENGTKSGFTPLPNLNTDNFMVVGDNVLTHWPMIKGNSFRLDSGTSFAAPVAASMAALILAFVEQSICKGHRRKAQELIGEEVLDELRENSGMIRLLKSVSFPGPDSGYLLIHPQLLWKDLQFSLRKSKDPSKCREHAWDVIVNALIP